MTQAGAVVKGLEGVIAAETALCDLDGENGRLAYQGYDIDDLARLATYEEVAYVLWHGELPSRPTLERFRQALVEVRSLPEAVISAYRLLPADADPMRALQLSVAMLGTFDPDRDDHSREANLRKAIRLTSQLATAICACHRVRSGRAPVPPSTELGHAANFLYMLTGQVPAEASRRAFDASLTLYAEHEMNASTFTARVVSSTLSDMHSAVAAGAGALRGPLHGGAGEAVMRTLQEIGAVDNVEAFTREALAKKRRLMGFGHRVYRAGDPRARVLRALAEAACRQSGRGEWFDLACRLHEVVNREKGLIPNVDFYSAPLFYALGIPVELFTPVIAAGRIAGWTAHILEQHADNRLIRPRGAYTGPGRRPFVSVDKRGG
ncbi:MAG: citrate/2-methylcitrate synthase [Candidatus Methylomirabilia bacterium]